MSNKRTNTEVYTHNLEQGVARKSPKKWNRPRLNITVSGPTYKWLKENTQSIGKFIDEVVDKLKKPNQINGNSYFTY